MGGEDGRAAASCPVKSWLVSGQKAEDAVTCNIVAYLFLAFSYVVVAAVSMNHYVRPRVSKQALKVVR